MSIDNQIESVELELPWPTIRETGRSTFTITGRKLRHRTVVPTKIETLIHEWITERARRIAWERCAKSLALETRSPHIPVVLIRAEDMDMARAQIEPLLRSKA